ncbi:membrane protein [Gordonia phage Hexbug]|nr:membrane protein [Gordonia phage Orla]UVK62939.1 membrane protein [Gordonia phage Hexbug]WNN96116.1 membrane protein [Gordonia phage Nodigi]
MSNKKSGIPPWVIWVVILVVTGIWAANFVAQLTIKDYDVPAGVDTIMLAVVGMIAGAASQINGRKKEEDEDE